MTSNSEAGFGRALRAFRLPGSLQKQAPTALLLVPPNPWPGDATRGRTMLANTITLEGQTIQVKGSPWGAEAQEPWLVAMHSRNGGFAAFDADNTYYYLNKIPFADHGAMLDPPWSANGLLLR